MPPQPVGALHVPLTHVRVPDVLHAALPTMVIVLETYEPFALSTAPFRSLSHPSHDSVVAVRAWQYVVSHALLHHMRAG